MSNMLVCMVSFRKWFSCFVSIHAGTVFLAAAVLTMCFLVTIFETNVFVDSLDHWFCKFTAVILLFMVGTEHAVRLNSVFVHA